MSATAVRDIRPAIEDERADAAPPRRRRRSPLQPRKSVAFTLLMSIFVVYSLVPLAWLVINATKTQAGLFSSFGLWFDDEFVLFQNIWETLTYRDGIFLRWFGNTLLYVILGAGGATLLATSPATASRSSASPGAARSSPSCSARSPCRAPPSPCRRSSCSASSASRTRRGRSSSRR